MYAIRRLIVAALALILMGSVHYAVAALTVGTAPLPDAGRAPVGEGALPNPSPSNPNDGIASDGKGSMHPVPIAPPAEQPSGEEQPEEGAPGAEAPDAEAPDAEAPGVEAPDAGAPDAGAPGAEAPDAGAPPHQPIHRLPPGRRDIVLTFDDGPSQFTQAILEILATEKVPAAFFWIAGANGIEMAESVVAQGHQLGTHTVDHLRLTAVGRQEQHRNLADSVALLELAGRQPVSLMRPPYGAWNEDTLLAAQELGLTTVLWSVDSRDWELPGQPHQIVANVLAQVQEGAIILLHERAQTVEALPQIIRALRAQGYTFGRL